MKAQLFANLPESSLESIVLENNEAHIIWKDDGKEFYLNGELYDLVKTKDLNGKTILYSINDGKEKQILNEFAKTLRSQNDDGIGNKSGKHSIKFQVSEFTGFAEQPESIIHSTTISQFISYKVSLISSLLEITSPPPKRA